MDLPVIRHGDCSHCGECCKPDPSEHGNPLFSPDELAAPERVEGYCPMFRWSAGRSVCLGHGWHPFYLGGCQHHPVQPDDLRLTPSCTFTFAGVR